MQSKVGTNLNKLPYLETQKSLSLTHIGKFYSLEASLYYSLKPASWVWFILINAYFDPQKFIMLENGPLT